MKKRITIVSLLSVVSVFIACILAGNSIVSAKGFSYQYEVKHFSYKNADKYVFHKELKDKNESNNKEIDLLIEKYDLNKKNIRNSNDIFVLDQTIDAFGETEKPSLSLMNDEYVGESDDDSVHFVIVGYVVGKTERGNDVFCVGVTVSMRGYQTNQEDRLVIVSDSNGVYNSNYYEQLNGSYRYTRYYKKSNKYLNGGSTVSVKTTNLNGVDYGFKTPVSYKPNVATLVSTKIIGNYFVTATNDMNVKAFYIHNNRVFGQDVSITIGPLSITIPWIEKQKTYQSLTLSLYK